ncbi:MAG: hypothetical protein AB7S26_34545 [Sandaracinaceae bacterium]
MADRDTSDAESAALSALSQSARRVRLLGLLPGMGLGVAALYPTFVAMTAVQWAILDVAFVAVSGGAAALAMFACILAGRRVGEWLWAARRSMLCASLAERHGLRRESVEELARIVS